MRITVTLFPKVCQPIYFLILCRHKISTFSRTLILSRKFNPHCRNQSIDVVAGRYIQRNLPFYRAAQLLTNLLFDVVAGCWRQTSLAAAAADVDLCVDPISSTMNWVFATVTTTKLRTRWKQVTVVSQLPPARAWQNWLTCYVTWLHV